MNLTAVQDALEKQNISIAIDLGEHAFCNIDSNCPVAIKLKYMMKEAGVDVLKLITDYADSLNNTPKPVTTYEQEPIDSNLTIHIGNQTINLDMKDWLTREAYKGVKDKIEYLDRNRDLYVSLSDELFKSYLRTVQNLKKSRTLEQFKASLTDMIKYKVQIFSERTSTDNTYVFLFPCNYCPEYAYSRQIRYRIHEEYAEQLKRECYLKIKTNVNGVVQSVYLVDNKGFYQQHYHSTGSSQCWGDISFRMDNFSLENLYRLKVMCENSLKTVNFDSPLTPRPTGMPTLAELRESGVTEIGREGVVRPQAPIDTNTTVPRRRRTAEAIEAVADAEVTARTGWGRRT